MFLFKLRRGSRRLALLAGMLAATVFTAHPSHAQPDETECNAALYYWKAVALMQQPGSAEELKLADLVDFELEGLPPLFFVASPESLRWLIAERPMLEALDMAARCSRSSFPLNRPGEFGQDLAHLPHMVALSKRALSATKAYEYADNSLGAVIIYTDLLQMLRHLDQDNNFDSGLAACAIMQNILVHLESFFYRQQPVEALAFFDSFISRMPERILNPGSYLKDEARRYGEWLLSEPSLAEERLTRLYGNSQAKPAVDRLATLDRERKTERLQSWIDDYRRRVDAIAAAFQEPYSTGLPSMKRADAERNAMQKDPSGGSNPLVPLLLPRCTALYQRFLLAEAQFDMAGILCAAALFRNETSTWPERLSDVDRIVRRPLPKDIFSGNDFHYRLARMYPMLVARVPRALGSKKDYTYNLDLGNRMRGDERRLKAMTERLEDQRKNDPNASVPRSSWRSRRR